MVKKKLGIILFCLILLISLLDYSLVVKAQSREVYRGDLWNLLNYYRIHLALINYKELEYNG